MDAITLKSCVNWCKHILRPLIPVNPSLHPDEKVYKIESEYDYDVLRHEISGLPIGIDLCYGPVIHIGEVNPQIGMPLKEICNCLNSDGEYIYTALVFKDDLSGN